jgi:hypothetical protein
MTFTLGAAAGSLLVAAFLPMAVASADEGIVFDSGGETYFVTDSPGPYPPTLFDSGSMSVGAGDEYWNAVVGYDSANPIAYPDALTGYEVDLTIGSLTNDDYIVEGDVPIVPIPAGTLIDVADFGGGYENEWIDVAGTGAGSGVSDLLITPFGDLPLLGTALG